MTADTRMGFVRGFALAVCVAAGCATSPYHRAGNSADVAMALGRAPRAPAPAARNLAFLALGGTGGPRIAAYDLAASKLMWTQPAEVTTRIEVGADVIVHGAKPAAGDPSTAVVVGRDIGNGAVLWQHPLRTDRLFGYALDGGLVYLVIQTPGATVRTTTGSVVALDARSGAQRWRRQLPSWRVAGPAARGGVVAVPLESQYVFLLDGATGADLAQALSTEEAATFVRALPEGLFYGSRGVFLLGPSTARGSRQAPGYLRAKLPEFVRQTYWYDQYRPEQAEYSALDRNRILWRVSVEGDRARFRDDLAIVHTYRFFFGFDAGSGALRWAHNNPSDAVASTDTGRALLFASADGELGALDRATGARLYTARLPGEVVRGATFDAESFAPAAGGTAKAGPPPELQVVLSSIIADPDLRFPELKVFAIEELGRQPGREVTSRLLTVLNKEGLPPLAYRKAGEALVGRRDTDSAGYLAAALKVRADYADDKEAPPVELLARAVGALGTAGRVVSPELVAHLRAPETPPAAAAQIARALAAVGAEEAVPALRDFITMYRTDPAYDADPTALVAAAEALLKLGDAGDRELLLFVAEEAHTAPALRAHLVRALGQTAGSATALAVPAGPKGAAPASGPAPARPAAPAPRTE